jgi:hypothetical protein
MFKYCKFILVVLMIGFMLPETGQAIPAFAKKYGFNCNMCHTAFAKLNDFGQRYRDSGYQIPGQAGEEKTIFETPPPIAIRTSTGLVMYDKSKGGSTAGFNIAGFDLLASGVLHKNISFLMIYTPRLDEPSADYAGSESGNPSQPGALEAVNIVFSNVIQDVLNIRVGKFEPGYHALSSKRKYFLFTPYEIYSLTTPAFTCNFDDNQIGVEATGHLRSGVKYALGIVNGTGANPDNNKSKDLYMNLSQTIGKGDGQSAGQRIGLFGYYGWQPGKLPGPTVSPTGETDGSGNHAFYRFGVNGSFNWNTFNLQGLFMKGVDKEAASASTTVENYNYTGGLVELDWAGMANNRLIASVLYNWVSPPDYDNSNKINAYSALLRYYLGDWSAVNIALHAEFTHKEICKDDITDNLFALVLDFAF